MGFQDILSLRSKAQLPLNSGVMANPGYRLSRRHQFIIYGVFAGLFLSGVVWKICHIFFQAASEFSSVPHPSEPIWLKIHGALAIAGTAVIGSLFAKHIPLAWQANKHRKSGSMLLVVNIILIVTGYLLYYAGRDDLRQAASAIHWWLGVGLLFCFAIHLRSAFKKNK